MRHRRHPHDGGEHTTSQPANQPTDQPADNARHPGMVAYLCNWSDQRFSHYEPSALLIFLLLPTTRMGKYAAAANHR